MLTVRIVPVPSNHSPATSRQPFMTRDAGWWNIWSFRKALTLSWFCYFLKGHPGSLFLGLPPYLIFPSSPHVKKLVPACCFHCLGTAVARGYRTLTPCILATQLALLPGDCHHLWRLQIDQLPSNFSLPSFSATLNSYKTLFFLGLWTTVGFLCSDGSSAGSWFN